MATRADLLKTIGTNVDESTLTSQELADRLAAYQSLSTLGDTQKTWDTSGLAARISAEIKPKINGLGASDLGVDAAANYAANALQTQGSFDPQKFAELIADRSGGKVSNTAFEDLKGRAGTYLPAAQQFYSSFYKDTPVDTTDYSPDISRVQQLYDARTKKDTEDQNLQTYIGGLPADLATSRGDYLSGLTNDAKQTFNESIAPEILQGNNARGLLYSGDTGDALAVGAGQLQGNIDSVQAQLEAQDQQFFADAQYQYTLQKANDANANYGALLDTLRNNQRTQQEQNFQAGETQLNNNLQTDLYTRQQERNLTAQNARLKAQRDQNQSAINSQLAGTIGSAVGTAVGSAVGGPPGGFVGSQVGQNVGTQVGTQIG